MGGGWKLHSGFSHTTRHGSSPPAPAGVSADFGTLNQAVGLATAQSNRVPSSNPRPTSMPWAVHLPQVYLILTWHTCQHLTLAEYLKSDRQVIAAGAINIHLDQDVLRASVLHQPSLLHQLYDPMVALTLAALATVLSLATLAALYAVGTLGGASPLSASYAGLTAFDYADPYNRSTAYGGHARHPDVTRLARTLLLGNTPAPPCLNTTFS